MRKTTPRIALFAGVALAGVWSVDERAFAVLALVISVFLLWRGFRVWRRARLSLAAAAMSLGGILLVAGALAILLGWSLAGLGLRGVAALALFALLPPALLLIESKRAPGTWQQWKEQHEQATLADFLKGEDVPET